MATKKNKYTDIDLSKYDSGYQKSGDVILAENNKINAENAVKNYGDFTYSNQAAYDKAMNDLLNRKEFSYDLNGDVLYQQYKDNYITQGKQASMDVMGMASAMTGGYGNSYAATVGNQTYQGYLQQLNNKIPELYQLALDKYNAEGDRMATNLGVLTQDRQTEYGEWGDKYNRLVADRDYHTNEYNAAYNRDYTTWTDNRDYDTSQYWNEYNTGYQAEQDELQRKYQAERDAIADAQWQKDFEEAQRQFNANQALQREQFNQSYSLQQQELAWKKEQAAAEAARNAKNTPSTDTSKVPDSVTKKLGSMTSNGAMSSYLNGLVSSGTITSAQAKSLYAQYRSDMGDYELVDDGGVNWGGGIDGNAKYRVYNHSTGKYETLTGDQLVKRVGSDRALEIQKHLGA